MWHVGIDLGRTSLYIAAVNDEGETREARRFDCTDEEGIRAAFEEWIPFQVVIEASGTYRWLYRLLAPLGEVILAHPLRLRSMVTRRSKTDKLDAMLLANLLRIDQVPESYIPPERYQTLRNLTRHRSRIIRRATESKNRLKHLLAVHNIEPPYRALYGPLGKRWLRELELGWADEMIRDELLDQLEQCQSQKKRFDRQLEALRAEYPEVEALLDIDGIGLYTALLVIGELGEVDRFGYAGQVASYAGLTPKVYQSGKTLHHGHISKQGSPWLRWILVEAALKAKDNDPALKNFYLRISKRKGSKIARVAVARKLAEICWKRLRRWYRRNAA